MRTWSVAHCNFQHWKEFGVVWGFFMLGGIVYYISFDSRVFSLYIRACIRYKSCPIVKKYTAYFTRRVEKLLTTGKISL